MRTRSTRLPFAPPQLPKRSRAASARILVPALALLVLTACQPEKVAEVEKPARPVLAQSVHFEGRAAERTFVATIRPRTESDLGFRVGGKVARRLANVGDAVKAGQALALLDETDLRLQREQADAELRSANAALAQADAELKRITSLRGEGWSTASAYDRQKAATEEARGRVARAERAASLAANALSYATLAADADGVVTAVQVEPGQVLAAGQAAIRLARLNEKEAVIAVPEAQVGGLHQAKASLSLWSNPDKRYEARLRELSPSADPATRTYLARFSLVGAGPEVQLGMTATLAAIAPENGRIARLPLSALFNQGSGPAVWVIDIDGRPVLRPVTVAAYESREVLISSGVSEGDQVVTLGVQKIDAGQRVRVVQALQF
jgi:RND family efflux transporter MFP subunit